VGGRGALRLPARLITHSTDTRRIRGSTKQRKFLYDDLQRWLRSPRQNISQFDDSIDSGATVVVWNHARTVAVKLQYLLRQIEYFLSMDMLGHTLVLLYVSQRGPKCMIRRSNTNIDAHHDALLDPLPSFGVSETANEIQ
jgi:hypothetical protein